MRIFVAAVFESEGSSRPCRTYFVVAHTDGEAHALMSKHLGRDDFPFDFVENTGRPNLEGLSKSMVLGWIDGPRTLKAA